MLCSASRTEIWPTHLLHALLVRTLGIAVDGEEVAQALSELEIVDRLWGEIDEDKALENLIVEGEGQGGSGTGSAWQYAARLPKRTHLIVRNHA